MELPRILSPTQVIHALSLLAVAILLTSNPLNGGWPSTGAEAQAVVFSGIINSRAHNALLTDFGGVGDGETLNTAAFQAAIDHLSQFGSDGGSMLVVPPGKWLTGSFNLTSNFTLYLHKDAVILASQNKSDWTVIETLPSYGRDGGRYISLIFGTNLTDVVITGANGTIDGQGQAWWDKFHEGELLYTRPYLIEIMYSEDVHISNLTLVNSPSWNVHPVYSRNVLVKGLTILSPVQSPNTDGINPDSCHRIKIEDCYIVTGGDCVGVKSGWDQYGIAFGMPTESLSISGLTCSSPTGAAIAIGSEMSGGISYVFVDNILAIDSESGIMIKTAVGRGGYIEKIVVSNMTMKTMKWAFVMTGNDSSHPDNNYDRNALPFIHSIVYHDIVAENVTMAGWLEGIPGHPFRRIEIEDVRIDLAEKSHKLPWNCSDVEGTMREVVPQSSCVGLRNVRPPSGYPRFGPPRWKPLLERDGTPVMREDGTLAWGVYTREVIGYRGLSFIYFTRLSVH